MSSSALPPLMGVNSAGARDDREENKTQKVKPLPLMLSSRAPLVQGAGLPGGSPGPGAPRSRTGATPPPASTAVTAQQQQQLQQHLSQQPQLQASPSQSQPHHLYPGGPDVPPSPGSPNGQPPGSYRNKFTRIRGFQGGQPQLGGLEGSGLLQQPTPSQQLLLAAGPGRQGFSSGGAGDGGGPHHGWEDGAAAAGSPPRRLLGPGGGAGAGSGGGAAALMESLQHVSSGGGAAPAPAWAARRSGLLGDRAGGTPLSGGGSARDLSPFEGAVLQLGGVGSSLNLAAVGSAPLAVRPSASATSAKHFASLPLGAPAPGRPDTAPSASSPPRADPLAATFPVARGYSHGLGAPTGPAPPSGSVPAAAINPPLQLPLAWPPTAGAPADGSPGLSFQLSHHDGGTAVGAPPLTFALHPHAAADPPAPSALSEPGGSPRTAPAPQLLPPPGRGASLSMEPQASTTAAQLLQRLYRTNRTPPSQTESLQDLLSSNPQRHVSPARSAAAAASAAVTAIGSRADSPGLPHAASAAALSSPSPLPFTLPSPTFASHLNGARSVGGGAATAPATAASSLSGGLTSAASRPGTTGTVGSVTSNLLTRPRGRGAAAGTLADLSAALQKSIAAGMGEWDLRADGTWGHPEIQQRLLRGPLGPEALKNRYRMKERDIISLYRLLYSYSVGFFTDVESLLEIAVSDRDSGAAVGLAAGSSLRQELLENVFRAYATLWDEALMIVFDSEMTTMLADKNAALRALDRGAVELEALKKEKEELRVRLDDFMKQNVDNMLASRHLQQTATRLEGEVYTLHNANEKLVTNMARHAVQVATLERQLDAARAATEAAEARAAAAEAHLGDLKAIVSEQNATLSAQFFQIKELERMCGELQETVRNLNRRRAAVLGLLSGNTQEASDPGVAGSSTAGATAGAAAPSQRPTGNGIAAGSSFRAQGNGSGAASGSGSAQAQARGTTAADGPARASTPPPAAAPLDITAEGVLADVSLLDPDELGRLLSDKTRAFNLMHADFVVKMHELDEQRGVNESLRQEVEAMKAAVKRADEAAAASNRTAAKFRAKFEEGRMSMEDLEEKNRKLTHKNAELVRSYWPLMTRLKEAEAEAARCREEADRDREQAAADRADADMLRAAAADTKAAMQELEERRAEAASHELELPSDLLALLPEGHVAALRRFARSCHRRVAHLNSQVVALVDQVTQLRLQQILQKEQQILTDGGGAGATADGEAGGGSAASAAALVKALAEAEELRSAVASRDRWLAALTSGMSAVMGQMENLMARDWETCRALRLEQERRRRRAAREAQRAARAAEGLPPGSEPLSPERSAISSGPAPASLQGTVSGHALTAEGSLAVLSAGGGGAAAGGSPVRETSVAMSDPQQQQPVSGVASAEGSFVSATAAPAAEASAEASGSRQSGAGAGSSSSSGEAGQQAQEQQQPDGAEGEAAAATAAAEGDEDGDDDLAAADGALSVAAGRLAQLVGVSKTADGVESSAPLVALDRAFDRLADSAERLVEWSEGLLRRKEQTATFGQVRQKLDTVSRQLEAATLELGTLRPTAEALRHSVRSYEVKFKEMSATVASCKQRADTAESRLESVDAQLSVVTQQLREAQDAQKLLEDEYWKAKDIALEAEVTTGELKAGRIRALEAAAKALSSVSGLEKEARENRDQRVALEADLVGYKAWVRHMEAVERKYRANVRDLADATSACEQRDRQLAELKERITTLEHQLRFKAIETSSLESRVKALSGELVEERRAARAAMAAARGSAAMQLDAAIRQAGAAESEAAAQAERASALEARLAEVNHALDKAQAAASAAEARLVPLQAERDRLLAHVTASQPLLQAMDRAADAIGKRLAALEDASGSGSGGHEGDPRFGLQGGSLDLALEALLDKVDGALDACAAVAAEAAGDATPALLSAVEGLAGQLLSTLSKGGKEPIQSLAVLKAQLARDDKELAALRLAMGEVRAASEEAAREAAEQRAAAAAAAKAASAATTAAARDARRAAAAEVALAVVRRDLDNTLQQLSEARLLAETTKRQAERSQKRAAEMEADLASAHSQRRHYEAQAAAARQKCDDLKRRVEELEEEGVKDQDAARQARERAAEAEAAVAASALRVSELEAAVECERREVERLRADAEAAVAAATEARNKAVELEQQMLETQSKYADMIRHDEAMEERLRQARFDAENMRKRAAEATAEAVEVNAQYEALQQRAWQLQVALQAKHGEKEEVLRELVEATHGAAARRSAAANAVGSVSVKQRPGGAGETATSFKAKRTGEN